MAQAPTYTPSTDFSNEERDNVGGRSTVRTAAVDAELANISASINALRSNQSLNQRDDGNIRDGRVKLFTLGSDVLALLASYGSFPRGAWGTATLYSLKDLVTQSGNTYMCVVPHVSGTFATDLAAGKWLLFSLSSSPGATQVVFAPTLNISATNVQAAIEELDSDLRAFATSTATTTAAAGDAAIVSNLANIVSATQGSSLVGYGGPQLLYAANTVGFKLKERRSICDAPYGCRPDGNIATGAGTTWTTQVQQAVNDAVAAGENSLFVPPGVFKTGQVTAPSGFRLDGAGRYVSVLMCSGTFNGDGLIKLNGAGGPPTTVSNLGVIAQNGGADASSIGINSAANGVFIENVWVSGFATNVRLASSDNFLINSAVEEARAGGTGVAITSTDVTVSNNIIYNCYIGVGVSGVSFLDGVVLLANNRTVACGFTGFLLVNSNNVQVLGCSAGHNNLSRYVDSGMSISNCNNVVVADFVGRLGGGPSTAADGIKITGGGAISVRGGQLVGWRDGLSASNVSGLLVGEAQAINNGRRGFYVSAGDRVNLTSLTAINDGGAGTTDAGIYVVNSASSSIFSVSGCMSTQQGGGVQEYGIYAELTDNGPTTGYINLTGNTCVYNGVADIQRAGAVQNINLSGNLAQTVLSNAIPDYAAASTISIPPVGEFFHVFGSGVTINSVAYPLPGRRVTLRFSSANTVKDGTGNLELAGDFATTINDTITLVASGGTWYEESRSAN